MWKLARLASAAIAVCAFAIGATAADYPTRPITVIVPYPPGGSADMIARLLADTMKSHIRQPVVVTNRPGGQGTIGTAEVARGNPDGYTLVLSAVATLTVQPHRQDLPYNTPDDYEPIINAANVPIVFSVHAGTPWKTMKEALDFARANPGKIRVGTPGNGSMGHLTLVSLNKAAKINMAHVPYASASEFIPSMLGGHIEAGNVHPPEVQPHVKAGTIRVLAAFEEKRDPTFPEAPTFRELGLDLTLGVYHPLVGPKGLPPEIKKKLYEAAKKAIEDPAFSKPVSDRGFVLDTRDPDALRQKLWASYRANGEIIKELGLGKK